MKIKDILSEGFWQGAKEFGRGALGAIPSQQMQNVLSNIKKSSPGPDLQDIELARAAYEKFGPAPGKESLGHIGWLTDEQFKSRIDAAKQKAASSKTTAEKFAKKTARTARTAVQQPASPTDMPDVGPANIPQGYRIVVQNPQKNATFYKYPDGRWTDEFGNAMPSGARGALEQFADTAGRMEQIPAKGVSGFKPRGARRAR